MLVIPTSFQAPRAIMFAILLVATLIVAVKKGICLDPWIFGLTFLCVVTSLFFIYLGILNAAPDAVAVSSIFVVWPLLFVFIVGVHNSDLFWLPYLKILVVSSFCIDLACLSFITDMLGVTNFNVAHYLYFMKPSVNAGIFDGMIKFHTPNLSTLLFTIPYLIAKLLSHQREDKATIHWRTFEIITLIGSVIILILSGRRVLWVVVAFTPFIYMVFAKLTGAQIQIRRTLIPSLIIIIGVIGAFYLFHLDKNVILESFVSGFDFSSNHEVTENSYRRKEQFQALVSDWERKPLFGFGHGAAAHDNSGMSKGDSAYELSYIAFLFQIGIIGVLIFFLSTIWLYLQSIRFMRLNDRFRVVMIPLITGLTTFLIANATNPYLSKFDYLWVVFLPVAVLNSFLTHPDNRLQIRQIRAIEKHHGVAV
jgi:hypothetical protein